MRKLITLLFIILSFSSFAQLINPADTTGTLITASIRPNSQADDIASVYTNESRGTTHHYQSWAELLAMKSSRLVQYQLATVADSSGKVYQYNGADWNAFFSGANFPEPDLSQYLNLNTDNEISGLNSFNNTVNFDSAIIFNVVKSTVLDVATAEGTTSAVFSGEYTGSEPPHWIVAWASGSVFSFESDAGSVAYDVPINGSAQLMYDGLYIQPEFTTGNDGYWEIYVSVGIDAKQVLTVKDGEGSEYLSMYASDPNSVLIGNEKDLVSKNLTAIGVGASSNINGASDISALGYKAGFEATNSRSSVFVGAESGLGSEQSFNSTMIGYRAGSGSTSVGNAVFVGANAGLEIANSSSVTAVGYGSGYQATNVGYSTFLGVNSGNKAANASRSIFIGMSAGADDLVNNNDEAGESSILIGNSTKTGGFSRSIALGYQATNTAENQLSIGSVASPINNLYIAGLDYSLPLTHNGGFLSNDGSGGLTWSDKAIAFSDSTKMVLTTGDEAVTTTSHLDMFSIYANNSPIKGTVMRMGLKGGTPSMGVFQLGNSAMNFDAPGNSIYMSPGLIGVGADGQSTPTSGSGVSITGNSATNGKFLVMLDNNTGKRFKTHVYNSGDYCISDDLNNNVLLSVSQFGKINAPLFTTDLIVEAKDLTTKEYVDSRKSEQNINPSVANDSVFIDFSQNEVFKDTITDVSSVGSATEALFIASNLSATKSRVISIYLYCDSPIEGSSPLAFPVEWKWLGTKPASMLDLESGILTLQNFGDQQSDIVASYVILN